MREKNQGKITDTLNYNAYFCGYVDFFAGIWYDLTVKCIYGGYPDGIIMGMCEFALSIVYYLQINSTSKCSCISQKEKK